MTTVAAQAPPAPARVPTPRPKHSRTSSLQSESTATSKLRPTQNLALTESGASPQQTGGPRRAARTAPADPLSDKATAFLIRRILCPQQSDKGKTSSASIEELLPPLTSRNDVDLQLYALIAIILREYVQNWYTKITPDETFVAEIVQIIAHITRALEQRLRKVDLESLLFDELPELLDRHVTTYRTAHDPITQPPVRTDPREIYHSLCPLPALTPVPRPESPESIAAQAENEAAYRQLLVSAVLAILLPTEDLENGCLTALVGQIFSELIIGNAVANRLSEPWLIWELLIISSRIVERRRAGDDKSLGQSNNGSPHRRKAFSVQTLFWTILQWCFLAFSFIRTALAILMASSLLPRRTAHGAGHHKTQDAVGQEPTRLASSSKSGPSKAPLLAFGCWSAISNLAEMDIRMPWLCGGLSMLQWVALTGPGRIAGVDGKLDRLLSYGIHRYVLDAANLPPLLRSVRGALFPNNMPAGKPTLLAPSSDAELRALRRRCASSLWALVPKGVGRLYFGGGRFLRASPDLTDGKRGRHGKTEGSAAELRESDMGEDLEREKEDKKKKEIALVSSQAQSESGPGPGPGLGPSGSGSTSGSTSQSPDRSRPQHQRSAPAPKRPNTGGLSADPSSTSTNSASASASVSGEEASGGTRLAQDDEKGRHRHDLHDDIDAQTDKDAEILDEIERGILDVFGDAYCNKHVVYAIVELILVRLLPELAEKGVLELWAERISV